MRLSSDFTSVEEAPDDREIRFEEANRKYPRIPGKSWHGMRLLKLGSSLNSISSSIEDYEELPGFRDMSYTGFGDPKKHFYAANDWRWSDELTEKIRRNNKIEPLIVGIDSRGPYILEGQHRFVALSKLGHQSFPALVLIDYDT
jgi:hypothetical protein